MFMIKFALIDIIASLVFVIPIFVIYEKFLIHNIKKMIIYFIVAIYFVAILSLVGFPDVKALTMNLEINIIPFIDMVNDFKNACLNILLFIPFGIFLPILWDKFRNIKTLLLIAFAITLGIELLQIFTFRITDINDIITNLLGALIGYFVAKVITKDFSRYIQYDNKTMDLYIIMGTTVLIMFLFQPFVASFLFEIIL